MPKLYTNVNVINLSRFGSVKYDINDNNVMHKLFIYLHGKERNTKTLPEHLKQCYSNLEQGHTNCLSTTEETSKFL